MSVDEANESFEFVSKLASSSSISFNSPTFISNSLSASTEENDDLKNCDIISYNDEIQLIGPSSRWHSQPRSYKGAIREGCCQRKFIRKIPSFIDITDGDTSGMGSSVDEPIESSTESASEASISTFQMPKSSSRILSSSPTLFKKRRGGWPKGTKRKPELQGIKAPKPKAPVTAYILYLNDRRKYYKETQSNLPYVEVFKLVGAEWSALPAEQKASYNALAEQEKKRYKSELQAYRQSPDYLLQLRKKRMKNTRKGETTTEESSDFTDEVDDDDSEELYCRICDQWFYSHHNKRVHLRGKLHGKAVMGEYQRERKAEELRQESPLEISEMVSISKNFQPIISEQDCSEEVKAIPLKISLPKLEDKNKMVNGYDIKILESGNHKKSVVDVSAKYRYDCRGKKFDAAYATEDDQEYDDAERDADEEYDGEEEITEEEGGLYSERVTDAAEDVLFRMIEREKEILWLRKRREKALYSNKKLSASLLGLDNRQKRLQGEKVRLLAEGRLLKEKIQQYSSLFNHHRIAGFSNDTLTVANLENFSTMCILGNDRNGSHDTEENNPWRIQCATSPSKYSGVSSSLKSKTKSFNSNLDPLEKVTENCPWIKKTLETNDDEFLNRCDSKNSVPRPLKLKMKFVKVKNLSSSRNKKDSSYVPKHSEYIGANSKPDAISCYDSPSTSMPNKCDRTLVDSQGTVNVPKSLSKFANNAKSFKKDNPSLRYYQPSSKSSLFANTSEVPISSSTHLNLNELNLNYVSLKTNLISDFDFLGCSQMPIDKFPENQNLENHIPLNTYLQSDKNIPSTSFSAFNTVKPPTVENISSFCFGSKHNDPNSSLIETSNIVSSPPFRDHGTDLISNEANVVSKVPNYNSFGLSSNKPINIVNNFPVTAPPSTGDLPCTLDYDYNFPCKDGLIPSQSSPSGIFLYGDSSANDSHIENISLTDVSLSIPSTFYDDKHRKTFNQPIICEETFFKQFGLDLDYQEHSKIIKDDIGNNDNDAIFQFPLTDVDLTSLLGEPN